MTEWVATLADLGGNLAMAVLFVHYLQNRDQRQKEIDERKIDTEGRVLDRVNAIQKSCHDHHARAAKEFATEVAALQGRANAVTFEQVEVSRGVASSLAELRAAVHAHCDGA